MGLFPVFNGSGVMASGLDSLYVDGISIENFTSENLTYKHCLPYSTVGNPTIKFKLSDASNQVQIIQPANLKGTKEERTVQVKINGGDGSLIKTYSVEYEVLPKLDIFLALGQSNMAGRGYLVAGDYEPTEDVYLLTPGGGLELASNPMNKYSSIRKDLSVQQMSLTYSFAKKIRDEAGVTVGIMQNARGGTTIEQWTKGSTDRFYEEAIRRANEIRRFGEIKGLLWHQGEGNASDPVGYKAKLLKMVTDFRNDLGIPDLFVVVGQIAQWRSAAFNAMIETVPTFVPNSDWVSSVGLTPLIDTSDPHFDRISNITLGERYADKVLTKLYERIANRYQDTETDRLKADIESGMYDEYILTTSGGNYMFSSTLIGAVTPAKSFILRAEAGLEQRPVVSFRRVSSSTTLTTFMPNRENITMEFEGLEFDGSNPGYAPPILIRTNKTDTTTGANCTIILKDCYIHDCTHSTSVIRIDHPGAVIDIQNTTFANCTGSIVNFIIKDIDHGDVTIKNSTFTDLSGASSIISYQSTTSGRNVTIDHCTFNKIDSSKDVFVFGKITGEINITNSIFYQVNKSFTFSSPAPNISYSYLEGLSALPAGNINNSFSGIVPSFANAGLHQFGLLNKTNFICNDGLPAGNSVYYLNTPILNEATNITSSDFTISWSSVPNARFYVVNLYLDGNLVETKSLNSDSTTCKFEGLLESATYTCNVIAKNNSQGFDSDVSNIINITTQTTGIDDIKKSTPFSINRNSINVSQPGKIRVFNLQGVKLFEVFCEREHILNLQSGVYVFSYTSNDGTSILRKYSVF